MTRETHETEPILVLGGTGKTGSRVVERLHARGVQTRVGSRFGDPPFDWEEPGTWARAVDGVGSAYLSYYPDLVVLPAGDEPEPFVDADDIADVAVAALTDDRHIGELYELTGPGVLTFGEAVAEIAKATGREIEYVPVSIEEDAAGADALGVPPEFVDFLTYLFSEVLGRNAYLTDGVERALGRKPKDFSDYARDAAATGIWDQRPVAA